MRGPGRCAIYRHCGILRCVCVCICSHMESFNILESTHRWCQCLCLTLALPKMNASWMESWIVMMCSGEALWNQVLESTGAGWRYSTRQHHFLTSPFSLSSFHIGDAIMFFWCQLQLFAVTAAVLKSVKIGSDYFLMLTAKLQSLQWKTLIEIQYINSWHWLQSCSHCSKVITANLQSS